MDDALFCGADKALVLRLKGNFMKRWECRDLGDAKEFLRMTITRKGSKISLDQCAYLDKILETYKMQNAKASATPLPANYHPLPRPKDAPVNYTLRQSYQEIIGSLLYLMLGTHPDISFAVTKLAQFAANPSQEHYDKAKGICRYLVGTRKYALVYNGRGGEGLSAYTDSDWGSDPDSRKSQTGFFLQLAQAPFSWTSRQQKTVALSSTEAEYMALSDCS